MLYTMFLRSEGGQMPRTITVVGQDVEKKIDDYLKRVEGAGENAREAVLTTIRQMPSLYRRFYLAALTGKSRKSALKVHCLECAGWSHAEVALCESVACALWPYRPFVKLRKRYPKRAASECVPTAQTPAGKAQ